MHALTFELIKRFLFDMFVVASLAIALAKLLAMEWKSLMRLFPRKRR
jgi:hypothetical protein